LGRRVNPGDPKTQCDQIGWVKRFPIYAQIVDEYQRILWDIVYYIAQCMKCPLKNTSARRKIKTVMTIKSR